MNRTNFPGEPPESRLRRSIRMHEFMITGGTLAGYDAETKRAIWTEDVDPDVTPVCPWHQPSSCVAWDEIRAGRGSGEVPSPTLAELRNQDSEELQDKGERIMIAAEQQRVFATEPSQPNQQRSRVSDELAFLNITEDVPDEIEFDGPEGEEGEEE